MALSDAAERRELVRVLRDQDVANPQIAAELRARFGVGPMLAWRWVTDLSLAEAAERYNQLRDDPKRAMTAGRLSQWERWPQPGGRRPTVDGLVTLAGVYGCHPGDLIATAQDRAEEGSGAGLADSGARQGGDATGTLEATLHRWDELMRRRNFLANAGVAAASVLVPGPPVDLPAVPADADASAIYAAHAALTASYRQLDSLLGPTAVYAQAIDHQRRLDAWLDQARGTPVWSQVAHLATDATILAAWLHFDLERFADAARLYRRATDVAGALGDVSLQAFLVGRMSRTLSECGHHTDAAAFADAAARIGGTAAAPVVRSWLAVTRAYVHACRGEQRACREDLDTAAALLQRTMTEGGEAPGPYIGFYSEPYLYKWTGHALLQLADRESTVLAEGRSIVDQALDVWSAADVRESGEVLTACARARIGQREIDEAARLTGRAHEVATATGSLRVRRYVGELRRRLRPYRHTRAVRDLDERLLSGW
jgi:hypothetical protein